jgi:hypothetical protein
MDSGDFARMQIITKIVYDVSAFHGEIGPVESLPSSLPLKYTIKESYGDNGDLNILNGFWTYSGSSPIPVNFTVNIANPLVVFEPIKVQLDIKSYTEYSDFNLTTKEENIKFELQLVNADSSYEGQLVGSSDISDISNLIFSIDPANPPKAHNVESTYLTHDGHLVYEFADGSSDSFGVIVNRGDTIVKTLTIVATRQDGSYQLSIGKPKITTIFNNDDYSGVAAPAIIMLTGSNPHKDDIALFAEWADLYPNINFGMIDPENVVEVISDIQDCTNCPNFVIKSNNKTEQLEPGPQFRNIIKI